MEYNERSNARNKMIFDDDDSWRTSMIPQKLETSKVLLVLVLLVVVLVVVLEKVRQGFSVWSVR